jgi:hypothetical protein
MKARVKIGPKHKRGRPFAGGRDPVYSVRLPKDLVERVDRWGGKYVTRSEAIRRLLKKALTDK